MVGVTDLLTVDETVEKALIGEALDSSLQTKHISVNLDEKHQ
ncbi:hypothetical protein [Natrinema versiforme]|nr:hypothetical protein [Natrinema versiforme]